MLAMAVVAYGDFTESNGIRPRSHPSLTKSGKVKSNGNP